MGPVPLYRACVGMFPYMEPVWDLYAYMEPVWDLYPYIESVWDLYPYIEHTTLAGSSHSSPFNSHRGSCVC